MDAECLKSYKKWYKYIFRPAFSVTMIKALRPFFLVSPGSTSWSPRRRVPTGLQCVMKHRKGHVTLQHSICTTCASTCFVYKPTCTGVTLTGCRRNSGPKKMVSERDEIKTNERIVGENKSLKIWGLQHSAHELPVAHNSFLSSSRKGKKIYILYDNKFTPFSPITSRPFLT